MSKIKILFSALAVVVGIGGAFASKTLDSTAWYFVDANGNPTTENVTGEDCLPGKQICQKQYNVAPDGTRLGETGMTRSGEIHQ